MPIYQLDPNAANRQQLQFFMSQIALFAMQRAQQKARLEELEKQTAAQEKLFGLKLEAEGLARQPRGARTREVELAGQGEPTTTTGTVTVREPAEKPTTVLGGRPLVITPRKDYQQFLSVEDGRLVIRSIPKGEPGQGLPVGESATSALIKAMYGNDSDWTKPDLNAALDTFLAENSPYNITTRKGFENTMQWFKSPEVQTKWKPYYQQYLRDTSPTTYIGTGPQGDLLTLSGRGTQPVVTSTPTPEGQPPGPKQLGRLPPEPNKDLNMFKDIYKSTQDVANLFKPSFVGPVVGRARQYGSALVAMPDFVKFRNKVGQLRTIVYGLSGKQINEVEQKWLENEILPSLKNPGPNFMATLEVLQDWVKTKHDTLYDNYTEEGYIVGGGRIKSDMSSYFRR